MGKNWWIFFTTVSLLLALPSKCHVLNYDSVTVCNGILKEIQCPNDENIHVLQGFYGKWRNHDCHGESVDPDNLPTCREDRSRTTGIVKGICQGKNTCTLEADNSFYGEPCPENKAYLYVTFFCLKNGKKLIHHRTMTNEEVVTVPSHGYIIREEKSHLQEEREEKAKTEAIQDVFLKSGGKAGNKLNPNPRPTSNNTTQLHVDEKATNLIDTTPVEILDFIEKKEKHIPDNEPLMFSSTEDAMKVEDALTFEKVKEQNAETRKLKEFVLKDNNNKTNTTIQTSHSNKQLHNNGSNETQMFRSNSSLNDQHESNNSSIVDKLILNSSIRDQLRLNLNNSQEETVIPLVRQKINRTLLNSNTSIVGNDSSPFKLRSTDNYYMKNSSNFTTNNNNTGKILKESIELTERNTNTTVNNTKYSTDSKRVNPYNKTSLDVEGNTVQSMRDYIGEQLESSPEKTYTGIGKSLLPKGYDVYKAENEGEVRSTIICNGESKLIACLPEEEIKVHDAFYGKRSGEDCKGNLPYKDDSPTCSALDAKENVQKSCNNKQTCLLFADENIYGKSLCPHVNKYLHLKYTCTMLPDQGSVSKEENSARLKPHLVEDEDAVSRSFTPRGNKTVKLCNGERKKIHCDEDDNVKINSAFYGKRIGTDCRGDLGYRDDVPECNNPRALDTIKLLCDSQKTCELISEDGIFGDDVCPGVNKYLEVGYMCK